MKKKDFLLIGIILIIALVFWFVVDLMSTEAGGRLRISVDNETFGTYELSEDQEILIGDTNTCQIKNGQVVMIYGKCPDQVCVHSRAISKNGQTIICMPNKVVLEIIDSTDDEEVDIIVR